MRMPGGTWLDRVWQAESNAFMELLNGRLRSVAFCSNLTETMTRAPLGDQLQMRAVEASHAPRTSIANVLSLYDLSAL